MNMIIKFSIVNHRTYLRGPTDWGTIACTRRHPERVGVEINLDTVRLTNTFKLPVGSEVPLQSKFSNDVQGANSYVVVLALSQPKQPSISYTERSGGPKSRMRLTDVEFGIFRNTKVWGRRRIHSTSIGKGSSASGLPNDMLSGVFVSKQFLKFKKDIRLKNPLTNLSIIMSDPDFLIASWLLIRSNIRSGTKAFGDETMDGINKEWFEETANSFRNGSFKFKPARRTYIPKPNGKKRPLTMPSPRDKIVQNAMKILLEMIYEPEFRPCATGWRPERGCSDALLYINRKFANDAWYIEGDIEQMFPSINQGLLAKILSEKIKDQAFMDLIHKYFNVGYGEKENRILFMPIGVVQGGQISPVLANIYMMKFDNWVQDVLIPEFTKGKRKKQNPEYTKMLREKGSAVDKSIQNTLGSDPDFRRVHYVRYADDFLVGVDGSKEDCIEIRQRMATFLENELSLTMNVEKTKITHATKDAAVFLGYRIYKTKLRSMAVKYNSKGVLTRRTGRAVIDGVLERIVKRLTDNGFAKKGGIPTRNGKFIYLNLYDLVEHYRKVERGILNYYSLAYNYGRVSARVHYILKYSCALTIRTKMRLKSLRKVFRKYGSDLRVTSPDGERETCWPTISYKRPKVRKIQAAWNAENMVDSLSRRLNRGRGDLVGPCRNCGSWENIVVHHVRKLKNINRKDYIGQMMARMNRKQITLCQSCHIEHHKNDSRKG